MHQMQEEIESEIGQFTFEVYGSGRNGRSRSSRFQLRCDAVALHENQILLLSVVGAETSVKALTAGLRCNQAQKAVDYTVHLGDIHRTHLARCSQGYRVYRSKLGYGLWHVLCLAKRDGFMPIMTDETIWQLLQKDEFTTPLSREWVPWLYQQMQQREIVLPLDQRGCRSGLLVADSNVLDKLVCEGIQSGHVGINGQTIHDAGPKKTDAEVQNLDEYMLRYGPLLGKQAERFLEPLHVPGRDILPTLDLIRDPFEAQLHVIEATRKALARQKALLLVGEMGTGKTLMGMAAIHAHANNRPYRALVFCPGQLVNKWEREIRETIPDARVIQIERWTDLLHLRRMIKPVGVEWYIIARDRAKLGPRWRPAFVRRKHADDGFLRCPHCGHRLVNDKREPLIIGQPGQNGQAGTGLWKRRSKCEWVLSGPDGNTDKDNESSGELIEGCGSPLWQMNGELWRYEPALYIKRHLKRHFEYLILDEVHEEKGAATAQGHAAGALSASCRKVIALTGTLIGGYAEHLRPLLFRLAPASLVHEGLRWSDAMAFNERYGRIETRISKREGSGEDNRMSRGSKSTVKLVRPGIMPVLFGRHLIDKTVFLSLSEVANNLPTLEEECVSVPMDHELGQAYRQQVERPLVEAIRVMMAKKDKRLLGTMLQTLLAYPDFPFGWGPIGYWDDGEFVTVAMPPNLSEGTIHPKEIALIDLIRSERAKGRKVWVYVQFTDKHDVQGRLAKLLLQAGLRVDVLRSSVPLARREAWIAQHGPKLDVVISHPRLVETGLDLFDKCGRHNFPTICFYETGYNLFTLRQASRRAWRIGQTKPCRVVYFSYEATMQTRALALMGRKLTAAQALEGTFSSEGLVAMAGEDANIEMALARSLVERMDEGDARRLWNKTINQHDNMIAEPPPCGDEPADPDSDFWLPATEQSPRTFLTRKPRRRTIKAASSENWLF